MFGEKQKIRISNEKSALLDFVKNRERLTVSTSGDPSIYYRIGFHDVKTTVVDSADQLKMSEPPSLKIIPVSFDMVINLGEHYPMMRPFIVIGLAKVGASNAILYLFNTHINYYHFVGSICLYSHWHFDNHLVDLVCRAWNVITYNHDVISLNKRDVLNGPALDYYKNRVHQGTKIFPCDEPMEYRVVMHEHSKKKLTEDLFRFSD